MYKLKNGFTKQSMLEQIKKYNNGTLSGDGLGACYYSSGNNRCLLGCFIPDNHEALKSGLYADSLINRYIDLENKMPLNVDEMEQLQRLHDGAEPSDNIHDLAENWINENVEE